MKSFFQPIQSPVRVRTLFKDLVAQQSRIRLWPRGKKPPQEGPAAGSPDSVLEAEFNLTGMSATGEEFYCSAVDSDEFRKFKDWCAGLKSGSFIVTIQSPIGLLFMNSIATELRPNAVRLHAPLSVYEVQRRATLRAKVPDQLTIRVSFDDPQRPGSLSMHEVIDVSEGGLSFAVPEVNGKFYSRGASLGTIRFTLAGRLVACRAVVRSRRKGKLKSRMSAYVVGVQFEQLDPSDRAWIGAWVLRQSRYIVQQMNR